MQVPLKRNVEKGRTEYYVFSVLSVLAFRSRGMCILLSGTFPFDVFFAPGPFAYTKHQDLRPKMGAPEGSGGAFGDAYGVPRGYLWGAAQSALDAIRVGEWRLKNVDLPANILVSKDYLIA